MLTPEDTVPTTYAPEVVDQHVRAMRVLLHDLPYSGLLHGRHSIDSLADVENFLVDYRATVRTVAAEVERDREELSLLRRQRAAMRAFLGTAD